MSKALPDYYAVLGLTPNATPEQLKKRYRELARRYHPDVNPSADASNKIKAVNEAYHILGDAERRERYDAERLFAAGNDAASGGASSTPRPASAPPGSGPNARPGPNRQNGANRGGFGYDGFGRSNGAPRPSAPPPNVAGRPPSSAARNNNGSNARSNAPTPEQRAAMVEGFLTEAQFAFINHKYSEAEDFCRRALAIDRRNATAHEIMGDVFLKQHKREEAATAYSYAIQANPRNYAVQGKLERLMGGKVGPETRPDDGRARFPPRSSQEARQAGEWRGKPCCILSGSAWRSPPFSLPPSGIAIRAARFVPAGFGYSRCRPR